MSCDAQLPEPDYRYTLANERTVLAWLRTALGLLAGGVAVDQLPTPFEVPGANTVLALSLVALSVLAAVGGALRWRAVDQAMRKGAALPRVRLPWLLAAGLVVVGVAFVVIVTLRAVTGS